jgi:hypothetical protein
MVTVIMIAVMLFCHDGDFLLDNGVYDFYGSGCVNILLKFVLCKVCFYIVLD